LICVRDFELPQAVDDFQEVISDYPNLKKVNVSLGENKTILVQFDIEALTDLKNKQVSEWATEQMLEILSAVLLEPWDVTVEVIKVEVKD